MKHLLIAVGSKNEEVCSIGAFARAEAVGMRSVFEKVTLLVPNAKGKFPVTKGIPKPDVIFFHAPAIHDRKKPWNAIKSAALLRLAFPKARFISEVHEFFEAPIHWKLRQLALAKISHGVIVNTMPDYQGISSWHNRVLKSQLGPTMFSKTLISNPSQDNVLLERGKARQFILDNVSTEVGLDKNKKWILHPGLVTPGKGVDHLAKFAPYLKDDVEFIVVGGSGPKKKDLKYTGNIVQELKAAFSGKLRFIDSPNDDIYQNFLSAADLVVLPYDIGLSERRSSFLSAMCCGGNIWTTVGDLSWPLNIEETGVHRIAVSEWQKGKEQVLRSVYQAATETEDSWIERRIKNLRWAKEHTWEPRAQAVKTFLGSL